MKTLLLLLATIGLVSTFGAPVIGWNGKETVLEISSVKVKSITRVLDGGKKQTWALSGPNKDSWVDESGKKVASSNYVFKAPGTIVIKKTTVADGGLYDYEPLVAPPPPPKGVHVDPHPQGLELQILDKL